MSAIKVVVDIPGETSYDVRISAGALDVLGQSVRSTLAGAQASRVVVITDEKVAAYCGKRAKASLVQAGYRVSEIAVAPGEASKSVEVAAEIWEAMARLSLGRDSVVVALGGGVVGDLAGFVAATYMRGVEVVQVPTTLLAMVDSSVGGKTAINLAAGKNLVGTFKQPCLVCADSALLHTLDQREWVCGCAEIAKIATIDSDEFFFWLSDSAPSIANRDQECVEQAIARAVVAKAQVVAADATERSGIRECLNYGHTLGHAIESVAGYGRFSHGVAVAEGMRFAAQMASAILGTAPDMVSAQAHMLDMLGLGELAWSAQPDVLLDAMKRDKKVRHDAICFVLPRDVGVWELREVDDKVVREQLGVWADNKHKMASTACR